MKEERKIEMREMANGIDHKKPEFSDFELAKKDIAPDISESEFIDGPEIPKCNIIPTNGRIFVVEVTSKPPKAKSGLWLPKYLRNQKNDDITPVNRYYVVDWDRLAIPDEVQKCLKEGIEVHPFIPDDAIGYNLPRIIDWSSSTEFSVLHYTELGGISKNNPE